MPHLGNPNRVEVCQFRAPDRSEKKVNRPRSGAMLLSHGPALTSDCRPCHFPVKALEGCTPSGPLPMSFGEIEQMLHNCIHSISGE